MNYFDYFIKLNKSINKFKLSSSIYLQKRPTIQRLPSRVCKSSGIREKEKRITSCNAFKKNGSKCPSIRKKGALYCHRHYSIFKVDI